MNVSANGIRDARRNLGLSQERLAAAADCSASYIRLLERGFDPRYSEVLPRVLGVLGLDEKTQGGDDE